MYNSTLHIVLGTCTYASVLSNNAINIFKYFTLYKYVLIFIILDVLEYT